MSVVWILTLWGSTFWDIARFDIFGFDERTHPQEKRDIRTGLPDGLFLNNKTQFWQNLEGLGMENVVIFYGNLKYLSVTCYNLYPFVVIWYIFPVLVCLDLEESCNPAMDFWREKRWLAKSLTETKQKLVQSHTLIQILWMKLISTVNSPANYISDDRCQLKLSICIH
jgi:hypothetical protein